MDGTISPRYPRTFQYYYENLSVIPDVKRFDVFDQRLKAMVNLFNDFKVLLVKANDDARANGIVIPKTGKTVKPWRPDRLHLEIARGVLLLAAGWLVRR